MNQPYIYIKKKKKKDIKPLMPLALSLGSIFGLEPGQLQGLQACECSPTIGKPAKRPRKLP